MTNELSNDQMNARVDVRVEYDLEERTTCFSEKVIDFCKTLPQNVDTRPLISQLVRSATSISANYCEADEANSKRDFVNKIVLSKKETRETKHWLRLIGHTLVEAKPRARELWQEAQQYNLIFAKIVRSCNNNSK